MSDCKASVYDSGQVSSRPCQLRAIRDGYCAQHHPDAEKKRMEKSDRRYREKQAAEEIERETRAVALLKRKGYTVIPPEGAPHVG